MACHDYCPAPSVGAMNTMVSLLTEYLLGAQCDLARPEYYPPDYGRKALIHGLETYDFVIIGAGSAGSVIATRLSENPQWKVLVLEAGGNPPQESEVPALSMTFRNSPFVYNYYIEPNGRACRGFQNEQCYWPRGKVVGGSGAVNGLMYLRGNRCDYDKWLAMGNPGWGYDQIWPYFEKSVTAPSNDSSGSEGYIEVNDFIRIEEDLFEMLFKAAQEMGQALPSAFGKDNYIGYSRIPGTVKDGRRTTTAKGYLTRASKRKNLHVIKNAQVTKLNFDWTGKRVKSIKFRLRGRKSFLVKVRREVILSAGSIDTPKLLMLSGIGPPEVLKPLNIPVLKNLPVGKNLQDHALNLLFVKFNDSGEGIQQQLDKVYQYLVYNNGPLATIGPMSLVGLIDINGNKNSTCPDLEIIHQVFKKGDTMSLQIYLNSVAMKYDKRDYLLQVIEDYSILLFLSLVAHPKSRGTVTITSSSYKDAPKIDANYFAEMEDEQTMLKALDYVVRFVNTSALQDKQAEIIRLPLEECDRHAFKSEEYWRCYIQFMTNTCYHPAGTAKMGPVEDNSTVVDARLRVKGVKNLRVVDASIMSTIPGVNINGPTIMIAEKAADMVKEDWSVTIDIEEVVVNMGGDV